MPNKKKQLDKKEEVKIPKKRGRKPKNKSPTDIEKVKKIPKKRGRKPKEVVADNKKKVIKDEPIILHLPVKNIINKKGSLTPKPFINNNTFNSNFKNISGISNDNDKLENIKNNNVENTISKFKKLCNEYNNVIERDKVFPIFLEYNEFNKKNKWPDNTNIHCLWCCHEFNNFPFGIPIKKMDNTYHMFGNFCSGECAAAYNFDNTNTHEAFERFSMLNYLYSQDKKIKLAAPRIILKKFGGQLSIEEFRKNNNILDKQYKVLLPPMISLIPTVEEENLNEQVVDPHDLFKTETDELKLKRSKPLPDFCNTLESCMNLKLV